MNRARVCGRQNREETARICRPLTRAQMLCGSFPRLTPGATFLGLLRPLPRPALAAKSGEGGLGPRPSSLGPFFLPRSFLHPSALLYFAPTAFLIASIVKV